MFFPIPFLFMMTLCICWIKYQCNKRYLQQSSATRCDNRISVSEHQCCNVVISCPRQSRAGLALGIGSAGIWLNYEITEPSKTARSCSLCCSLQSSGSRAGEGKVARLSSCWGEGPFPSASSLSNGRRGCINSLAPIQHCPFLSFCFTWGRNRNMLVCCTPCWEACASFAEEGDTIPNKFSLYGFLNSPNSSNSFSKVTFVWQIQTSQKRICGCMKSFLVITHYKPTRLWIEDNWVHWYNELQTHVTINNYI